jgi:hypothetical protein
MIREAMNKPTFRILVGKNLENIHLRDIKSGSITSQHKRGQFKNMEHKTNSGLCTMVKFGNSGVTIALRERSGI